MGTTYLEKANNLVMQGLCGFVVGLALTSGLMLESGSILGWLVCGFCFAGFPYGWHSLSGFFFGDTLPLLLIFLIIRLALAIVIGILVYPFALLFTLFQAKRIRKQAIHNGYILGSPFSFFERTDLQNTPKDYRKKLIIHIFFLVGLFFCLIFTYSALRNSIYRNYGLKGSLTLTGYIFGMLTVGYRALRDSWDLNKDLGGFVISIGIMLVYSCIGIDITCIIAVLLEHILDLENWRTSDFQQLKLFSAVGITLSATLFFYLCGKVIYYHVHLTRIKKEAAIWYASAKEYYMQEEMEDTSLLDSESTLLREKQKRSWEKMKQQRRDAERKKTKY